MDGHSRCGLVGCHPRSRRRTGPGTATCPRASPREVAVPRGERVRMRDAETEGKVANESARRATPAPSVSNAPASNADDGEQRRGAVRRPPSGDSGARSGSGSGSRAVSRGDTADRTAGRGGSGGDTADRSGEREPSTDVASTRDRAVPRTNPPGPDHIYVYPPSYYTRYYDPCGYGAWGPGFAYFTPWGWGPGYYGSYGYGYGYGGYGGYGGGYGHYAYDIGSVKLKVKQRDAEVYVDNYFAGYVDDFDGMFQALKVEAGGHRIEVRKPGFETLQFDVHVQPERSVTFKGEMKPQP